MLVHEAPIDEKTKEVRKMFDVDEKTGLPKSYNWRPLANLGSNYRPEKVYEIYAPLKPEEKISTQLGLVGSVALVSGTLHYLYSWYQARSVFSKPWYSLAGFAVGAASVLYGYDVILNRRELKNQIYTDYMQKHPDKFETVHRPKYREVLFVYSPIR